jgi:hypothetical protein
MKDGSGGRDAGRARAAINASFQSRRTTRSREGRRRRSGGQVAAGSARPRSTSEEHAPGTEGESDQTVPDAPISPVGPSQARGVGVRSTSSTDRDPGKPGSPRNRMSSVKGRGWSIIVSLEVVWLV